MRQEKRALLHEFGDKVAVVVTTVVSITGIVQFQGQNNPRGGRWFNLGFGLHAGGVFTAPAPAAAVGVAPRRQQ